MTNLRTIRHARCFTHSKIKQALFIYDECLLVLVFKTPDSLEEANAGPSHW